MRLDKSVSQKNLTLDDEDRHALLLVAEAILKRLA
jgi:hypothetical protein